jgi:hypothetical protein
LERGISKHKLKSCDKLSASVLLKGGGEIVGRDFVGSLVCLVNTLDGLTKVAVVNGIGNDANQSRVARMVV